MSYKSILVVCVGNICRSPVAELMLRHALPACRVESAGLAAVVGAGMESTARQLVEAGGLDGSAHRARQLTRELCRQADLILVMEGNHREGVASLCPEARGKTFLLCQGLPEPEVADPYRRSPEFFARVHARIEAGCASWAGRLAMAGAR